MHVAKKYVYVKRFEGFPSNDNIQLVEEELPSLQDGEVLFAVVYLSVDPYVRCRMDFLKCPLGSSTVLGKQVAKIVESKNKDYKIGEHYLIRKGWTSHFITNPDIDTDVIQLVPDYGEELPLSLVLGILGSSGATAYLGLVELLTPKAGEVVFVNAAAGAVGSVVGQVAVLLGCKVIGCAGSQEKVQWLKELGFHSAFNYRTEDYRKILAEEAPNGVDCFFDNVGGEFGHTVVTEYMAIKGRVAICGAISVYNQSDCTKMKVVTPFHAILANSLTICGFNVNRDFTSAQRNDAINKMFSWIKEGKLQYREHITEGFDNMRKAFFELFSGGNTGKAIVKV